MIDDARADHRWTIAVNRLLDAERILTRDELYQLGALSKISEEISTKRSQLTNEISVALVEQLFQNNNVDSGVSIDQNSSVDKMQTDVLTNCLIQLEGSTVLMETIEEQLPLQTRKCILEEIRKLIGGVHMLNLSNVQSVYRELRNLMLAIFTRCSQTMNSLQECQTKFNQSQDLVLITWNCFQRECLLLVSNIANVSGILGTANQKLQKSSDSSDSSPWTKKYLNKVPKASKYYTPTQTKTRKSQFRFQIEEQYQEVAKVGQTQKVKVKSQMDYKYELQQLLGSQWMGDMQLLPALYAHVPKFTKQFAERSSNPNDRDLSLLKTRLEDIFKEVFIPRAQIDFRGRCTSALENRESLEIINEGKIPAQETLSVMCEQLIKWTRDVPIFSSEILQIVEVTIQEFLNILQSRTEVAIKGFFSNNISKQKEIRMLMAQEPVAQHLGDIIAFVMEDDEDAMVSGLNLGGGGDSCARQLYSKLEELYGAEIGSAKLMLTQMGAQTFASFAAYAKCMQTQTMQIDYWIRLLQKVDANVQFGPLREIRIQCSRFYGWCYRVMRLEVLLLLLLYFTPLQCVKHVISLQDSEHLPINVDVMVRQISRVFENVSTILQSPSLQKQRPIIYVFGHIENIAAGALMSALQSVKEMNQNGIQRMESLFSALNNNFQMMYAQKDLEYRSENVFEKLKQYVQLLQLNPEDLLQTMEDNVEQYSQNVWRTLFRIVVPGRQVGKKHLTIMEQILTEQNKARPALDRPNLKTISFLNKKGKS
eukprot:TRINITY_DN8117_c0_g2_i1.p1 TRINITY_DN8117_c0_g2~~TRINITY_DN8117_c0_g2_i1.p1  ORF type:complete len:851 (+),score=93.86 TRINITY_DN8117_c0_g2_i1:264-2555(+)